MQHITFDYSPFEGRIPHNRIEKYHLEALEFVIDMYTPTQKLGLLNISYNDIVQAKKDYETHFSKQLSACFKKNLIDSEYGYPFKLKDALEYLDLDYKSTITFKRLLANGKVPTEHLILILEHIEREYRTKN